MPVEPEIKQPLAGLRILDLTSVLMGPFATLFLSDNGAEVIKVESPQGDPSRRLGTSPQPGMASVFQHINRGKRSVVLDLKHRKGLDALKRLITGADALVYNIRPQAMRRLGLSYENVRGLRPDIVYCGLLGYGEKGRYAGKPALDDVIQSISGVPHLVARSNAGQPGYVPMAMADRIVGLYAAMAILTALLGRQRGGQGYELQIPMFESMAHFVLVEHMFDRSFQRSGAAPGNPRTLDANRRPFQTLDGFISVIPYTDRHWKDLFALLGTPERSDDPRFASLTARMANTTELYGSLAAALSTRSTDEWLRLLASADIPAMHMNSLEDLIEDAHLKDVEFFQTTGEGSLEFLQMRSPLEWPTLPKNKLPEAPKLGEHSAEVLQGAGYSREEIADLIKEGVTVGCEAPHPGSGK